MEVCRLPCESFSVHSLAETKGSVHLWDVIYLEISNWHQHKQEQEMSDLDRLPAELHDSLKYKEMVCSHEPPDGASIINYYCSFF